MYRYLLALLSLVCLSYQANAQQATVAAVVATCGSVSPFPTYSAGQVNPITVDVNGNFCTSVTGGGGGGPVTAVAGAFATGSIVDMGPFTASWDSLGTPTGTINILNGLASIYEVLLNPGKIVGNTGATIDAAPGSNSTNAIAVQGVTSGKPVAIAGNTGATLDAAIGAATAPTNQQVVGGVYNTTVPAPTNGQSAAFQIDQNTHLKTSTYSECTGVINISQTTTTDVHTFTGIGHICSVMIVSDTAQKVGIDEGTGTTCETNGTALVGVSSTASATPQVSLASNGGFTIPGGFTMGTSADHLCVLQSSSGQLGGIITYADLAH